MTANAVRATLLLAPDVQACDVDRAIFPPGFGMRANGDVFDDGLWFQPAPSVRRKAPEPIQVTLTPFHVLAQTSDADGGNGGLLLCWTPHLGAERTWVLPLRLLRRPRVVAMELADRGFRCCCAPPRVYVLLRTFFTGVRAP
jgi:hypothetical protein